jgi:peroxiredoxin
MKNCITIMLSLLNSIVATTGQAETSPTSPNDVNPIEVGAQVPQVAVQTAQGKTIQLRELSDGTPTVFIFYRGGWCPYCNRHLAGLGEIEAQLKQLGYQILALSTDNSQHTAELAETPGLNYQLLSDARMAASKAFGIAYRVDDATITKLDSYNIDIEAASGQNHHLLPVPSVFIADAEGTITYRHFNADYQVRLAPEELLEAAKATR